MDSWPGFDAALPLDWAISPGAQGGLRGKEIIRVESNGYLLFHLLRLTAATYRQY